MGTQQIPATSVSAIKHLSTPDSFLACTGLHVRIAHLWVWLGLGYHFAHA